LRVTVESVPAAGAAPREHLGTALIANDCTGSPTMGNYVVFLSKRRRPRVAWRHGRVTGFPRRRLGPWDLLLQALMAAIGERNGYRRREAQDHDSQPSGD